MAFPLRPIAGQAKKMGDFCVFDIEAHKWIGFRALGFYDGKQYNCFTDIEEFFDFLIVEFAKGKKFNKKGIREFKVFAHFGGKYDFNFILDWYAKRGDTRWELGDMIPRGSGLLCMDMRFVERVDNGVRITRFGFFDSSALLPHSLAKLTESFGVEHKKGHFDFEKWDGSLTPELLEYLESDCRGLHEVLRKFYDWPIIQKAGPAVTIASQSLKVFRTFLRKDLYPVKPEVDAFVRRGYFGGRTEIFKPYFKSKKKQKLLAFDANSLYPSVMLEGTFPGNFKSFTYKYRPLEKGFYEAEVEVPESLYVPPLGTVAMVPTEVEYFHKGKKKKKMVESAKFIFPVGRFKGVFSTVELEYARSLGVKIISTGQGVLFKNAGPLFRDFIDTLYRMRLDAKEKGDGVTDTITKLIMNSTYGRFGLNIEREMIVEDIGQTGVTPYKTIVNEDFSMGLALQEKTLETFTNVAIAAWVTSLARIKMHKFYMECGRDIWYTDTDSIYTTKNFDDSKDLGKLKYEGEYTKACFLLPKTYALETKDVTEKLIKKITMKGFDKRKTSEFTVKDFLTALEGDMKLITAEQPEKFCTFKTAIRKNKFLAMTPKSQRTLKTRYDKRRIVKNEHGEYDTVPLCLKDGKVVN